MEQVYLKCGRVVRGPVVILACDPEAPHFVEHGQPRHQPFIEGSLRLVDGRR
jgi:hypothetical protein